MTSTTISRKWNPWPVAITAFFAVAICGCITFVIFCSRHPADLVRADYYEQEVRYQQRMEGLQRTKDQAPRSSVSYDQPARTIVVSLGAMPTAVSGSIELYRPSAASFDRTLKLQPDPTGVQKIDATTLTPGLWKVRVSWVIDKMEYLLEQQVVI